MAQTGTRRLDRLFTELYHKGQSLKDRHFNSMNLIKGLSEFQRRVSSF